MAIRPWREERQPAIFAAGSHDFIIFQVIYKIIGFRDSGKAYRTELFKSIVHFFNFAHRSPFYSRKKSLAKTQSR
jgi:hypothetical protein